jgi:hypothetical protein
MALEQVDRQRRNTLKFDRHRLARILLRLSRVSSEQLMLTRTIGLDTSVGNEEGHLYALSREALYL